MIGKRIVYCRMQAVAHQLTTILFVIGIVGLLVLWLVAPQAIAGEWAQMHPSRHPSARVNHAMASIGDGRVLLFGGWDSDGPSDETWVYDLSTNKWTKMHPGRHPSARDDHAMASIGDDKVLLFGGQDLEGWNDETWVYDLSANRWTQMFPSVHPSARVGHAMASIGDDKVLLFGGQDTKGFSDETWIYDLSANTWTQMLPSVYPAARIGPTMARIGDNKVLLFGGDTSVINRCYETWLYDLTANNWTQMALDLHPPERVGHGLASIGKEEVIMFGGWDVISQHDYNNQTWLYSLHDDVWTQLNPSNKPSPRAGFAMASVGDSKVLLFGGATSEVSISDETWVYSNVSE